MKYDPDQDQDIEVWRALGELEQMEAVRAYHRRQKIRLPNDRLHASIHTIIENQVALGDTYLAKSVLARLMSEGLSRHDAVHAMGSVLSEQIFSALKDKGSKGDLGAEYTDKLGKLTADSWRKKYGKGA